FEGEKIHLTMYGLNIDEKIAKIRKSKRDKLIIVGGKKVPSEVYEMVDYNIAIGHQPHSEIAALAVFLDRLFEGKELLKDFDGKKKVIPQARGKLLIHKEKVPQRKAFS
ncbi:MAG TPA: tRNA (cytidine(56)-2'-O)-methyltransferase, partial [Candidatus Altiarchaeales archaeon]|nr:tRNA (cytidine(56)-2'-O)-methyltransferase [Candidatus Altiarchaeales archaeon]